MLLKILQDSLENTCANLFFNNASNFIKKQSLAQAFFWSRFSFTIIHDHRIVEKGGGYFFNSSLALPLASQTLRHWPGSYCREVTSAHSYHTESNWEPMVLERKSLTTTLCSLIPVNFAKLLRKPFLTEHFWASASRV